MTERRIRGFCALCKAHCGAIAVVDDDRLLRVEPDPDHPTGGALCIKGRAGPEIRANPNRILHPQLRTAPKGASDPCWRRITSDEALDRTAAAMRSIADRHGPEAVAFALASPAALDPGVVSGQFGWWQVGPEPNLANFAALIDPEAVDPISGTVTHRGLPCDVAAADDQAPAGG
jgi:anaerobic selenocysteine-containing dehydrogenase